LRNAGNAAYGRQFFSLREKIEMKQPDTFAEIDSFLVPFPPLCLRNHRRDLVYCGARPLRARARFVEAKLQTNLPRDGQADTKIRFARR
jgi:hypothetical protein